MLVEDLEDLRLCRLFVAFFHRAEFAREAARCRFEDLALRIALFGLVVGAEQVARHFGDRHEVARIDLRFIFLRARSEEHTSELQSLMRISYAVFCLKKNKKELLNTIYVLNLTSMTTDPVMRMKDSTP